MKTFKWWISGLVGALTLSIATVINAFYAIPKILSGGGSWNEFFVTVVSVFGMGFLCGLLVWFSLGLSRRYGAIGDIAVGVITLVFFFCLCMLIFDQSLLFPDPTKGLPMLLLAIPLGALLGFLTGRDMRAFLANQKSQEAEQTSSDNS